MKILFRRPSDADLDDLVAQMVDAEPTYTRGVGSGYREEAWSRPLLASTGWEPAKAALRDWRAHRGAGVKVRPGSPWVEGQTVALAIRLGPANVLAACRVTEVVDTDSEYGFTYATLPVHPERGEETFVLRRATEGRVIFHITATSAPADVLTKLGGPLSRAVQRRITDRYLRLDGLA